MFFNHKNTEPGQPQGSNPFFYYGGNYPGETSEPFYHSGIKNYNLRVSISTHIGKVRGNHEDNFYLEGLYMNDIFRILYHSLCRRHEFCRIRWYGRCSIRRGRI